MEYNRNKGFTLVELIMVIALVGILSVPAAYILMYFVQNSVYLPSQLNTEMVLADTLDLMINGDTQAKGLRFSRGLTSMTGNDVAFTSQDGDSVRYRFDEESGKLYRSVNGAAEVAVPYYLPAGMTVGGINGEVFTYFDGNESPADAAVNVRRIGIALDARDGQGQSEQWEGHSQALTAVAVPRFQP